jgi:hypothetical protein
MPRDHDDAPADRFDSLLRAAVEISEPTLRAFQERPLVPGDLLAERFVIERVVGSGGMGTIHRALDLSTRQAVAIKVVSIASSEDAGRFAQEAAVLAALSHGAIVRYVAHGSTPFATPFLAMEWLDGEDLAQRLARAPLSAGESLALLRRACSGVAAAHAHGIVHRDLKPSNLFLPSRDPAELKVLDFGIARQTQRARFLTKSGVVLGTVGYMAPEQAMGQSELDARADVFALGCVLFECLTGRAPFTGPNAIAVLAKVLCEEPSRVSELRPGLGDAVDALVARLLAKDPARRPKDAATVLQLLEELDHTEGVFARSGGVSPAEQKIVSVVLGRPRTDQPASHAPPDVRSVRELARRFGSEPVPMLGGGVLIVFSGLGAATDQASRAASCALLLAHEHVDLCVAVATGRAETAGRMPVGAAIDRAAQLVAAEHDAPGRAVLDKLTAALLEPAFEIERTGGKLVLAGKRAGVEAFRLLMGRPTPFVGRDKELGTLELTLDECVREQVARSVLVTALPGMGKSRLASEFVLRVQTRGAARVLYARADPMAARSALSLAQELIRAASALRSGSPLAAQRERLRAYLGSCVEAIAVDRLAEFLGEMVGISGNVEPSPYLRAARDDAAVMSEQTRRAFETWIDAECALGPLVIVLEDLHWSDAATLTYLEAMLRRRLESPLLVLALARPEVHELFPALWRNTALHEIQLGGLPRRAAERLVRVVLGQAIDQTVLERMALRADGNVFYLEELIRHVHESSAELPDTVLMMVQSRLERLDSSARRVLRAASVYGEKCWAGGVAALAGRAADTDSQLELLADQEILLRSPEARFAGEREYRFRHALLREGAYAMLTERDRPAAHRDAAAWLERAGERDPWILSEHFERGGDRERAIEWLVRAALRALECGDIAGAAELSRRGESLGAEGEARGALLVAQAVCGAWNEENSVALLEEAVTLLPEGTTFWWSALGALMWEVARAGHPPERATLYVEKALAAPIGEVCSGPHGQTLIMICIGLASVGQEARATSLIEKFERAASGSTNQDPIVSGWLRLARTYAPRSPTTPALPSAPGVASERILEDAQASLRILQDGGSMLGALAARFRLGGIQLFLFGARDDAQITFEACLHSAMRMANRSMEQAARLNLAVLDVERGRTAQALVALRPFESSADAVVAHQARLFSARAYAREQRWAPALERALQGRDARTPWMRQWSCVIEACVYRALQRPEEALEALDRAQAEPRHAARRVVEPYLVVARAETLHMLGQHAAAGALIRELCARLQRTAASFENRAYAHSFLNDIEAHARAFVLAAEWAIA